MVRRFGGEVNEEVASLAPDDMARVARRLAAYARAQAHGGVYGVAPIALSEAMGYLGVPAGAVVRAV
eukprot:9669574-Alexandrium_andersonii.AAC.1